VATLIQMIDPRYRYVTARIAFGSPLSASELDISDGAVIVARLVEQMHALLSDPYNEGPASETEAGRVVLA